MQEAAYEFPRLYLLCTVVNRVGESPSSKTRRSCYLISHEVAIAPRPTVRNPGARASGP
jgi:hypothetical protein